MTRRWPGNCAATLARRRAVCSAAGPGSVDRSGLAPHPEAMNSLNAAEAGRWERFWPRLSKGCSSDGTVSGVTSSLMLPSSHPEVPGRSASEP